MTTPIPESELARFHRAGRDAFTNGEMRAPALSQIVRDAIEGLPVGSVNGTLVMGAYLAGWEAAADEAPPEYSGDYTGVEADDYGVSSLQVVAPGAFIGEDPEPSTTPSLIFGDPHDMAVCVHGTPDQLRTFVARAAALVDAL